jgi:hypothetical protein
VGLGEDKVFLVVVMGFRGCLHFLEEVGKVVQQVKVEVMLHDRGLVVAEVVVVVILVGMVVLVM